MTQQEATEIVDRLITEVVANRHKAAQSGGDPKGAEYSQAAAEALDTLERFYATPAYNKAMEAQIPTQCTGYHTVEDMDGSTQVYECIRPATTQLRVSSWDGENEHEWDVPLCDDCREALRKAEDGSPYASTIVSERRF